ncbi:MAG: cation:proton antiporter [Candidatus Woesearchaeota archaeon]
MNVLLSMILMLVVAYLFIRLGKLIKVSNVVALLLCGLVLNIPLLNKSIIEPNMEFMFMLGDIALIFLMFLAGLESSWRSLFKERRDAAVIAVLGAVVPFFLGFITFRALGFATLPAFVVGVCMSITAEATKARVLLELHKLRSKVGAAMMGAGIIDDIIGLSLFVLVTYLLKEAHLKADLLIGGAILAFFLGVLTQQGLGREHHILDKVEKLVLILIIPFFFISVGLHFDMGALILNPVLVVIIVFIAVIGKLSGCFMAKPFTKFSWRQLHLIGWGMNSRGAVEMALAIIAFRSQIIPVEIYSGLIIMALLTTLVFPFVITRMIKNNPKIMD